MDYYERKDEFIELLRSRLDEERFIHSLNVASAAEELAVLFDADRKKAYIAGLLHDCTKNETREMQLKYFSDNDIILSQVERNNPKLWHAMTAPLYAKNVLGIEDEEMLLSLRFHTTGRSGMGLMEKIIYIADYISAERDYPDVGVMRRLSAISLDKAALYSLKYSLSSLSKRELLIHPDSLSFYNELILNGTKTEELQ